MNGRKPCVSYLGLQPLEKADAEGTLKAIEELIKKEGVMDWKQKLVGCCFDGASVNMGSINGLAQQLKNQIGLGNLAVVHCLNHRLELALNDASQDVAYLTTFEDVIKGLYKLYNRSPKLLRCLKEVSEFWNEKHVKCLPINNIRWISSKYRAVSALQKNVHIVSTHLQQIISNKNEQPTLKAKARGFLKHLTSFRFIKFLFFMCGFSKLLTDTSLALQKEKLSLSHGINEVKACIARLENLLDHEGEKEKDLQSSIENDAFRGIKLVQQSKRGEMGYFEEDRRRLLSATALHLNNRLSTITNSPILSLLRLLDPAYFPDDKDSLKNHGCEKMAKICVSLQGAVTHKFDVNTVLTEYSKFKVYVNDLIVCLGKRISLESLFSRIIAEEEDVECFPNIIKLMELIFIIPISTAPCERGFSSINRIKTTFRTRLQED